MKIVVIGDGKIGTTIIEHLSKEGHEIVAIDKNQSAIDKIIANYDVMGICGNGVNYETQLNAGVSSSDIVIAVTSSDEANILACLIAKKIGAKSTIARVRNVEYSEQVNVIQDHLGISMIINPEREAAREIMKIINFPEAMRVDSFAKGIFELVELFIPSTSPLVGKSLYEISQEYQVKVLVCAVQRKDDVFIPSGDFIFEAEDIVHITANSKTTLRSFLNKSELLKSKLKSVMMIGGGILSTYLAKELIKGKYDVKIIEKDYDTCVLLSSLLPEATIIHGDGSEQNLLDDEGFDTTDVVVSLTGMDEENIITSMYAFKHNVKKIITKVNRPSLAGLLESIKMVSVIAPKDIAAARIIRYVRAQQNAQGSNVVNLYKLVNNKVEALEFIAHENKKLLNIPLRDLKLKKNILIGGIIRNGKVIIPSGNDCIMLDDNVLVVSSDRILNDLKDILE